jgi:hypothetical protein
MKVKITPPAFAIALICCMAIHFYSCTASRLTDVWKDPSYNLGPMKTMIVISMKKDPVRRRLWEDAFTAEFLKYGVTATPSYYLFPDNLPDTNRIDEAIHLHGYDGVLIESRLRPQIQTTEVPAYVTTTPVMRYNPWRHRYDTWYQEEYHPGYTDTSKTARHEADVWTTRENGRMVWSGTCSTQNPASSQQVHEEMTGLVVSALAKAGIIPAGRQ